MASTLTEPQLAHKRAKDREAQRVKRAKTKEHLFRLERELEQLKKNQHDGKTFQDLLDRNRVLESELAKLQKMLITSSTASSYGLRTQIIDHQPYYTLTLPNPSSYLDVIGAHNENPCTSSTLPITSGCGFMHHEEYRSYVPAAGFLGTWIPPAAYLVNVTPQPSATLMPIELGK